MPDRFAPPRPRASTLPGPTGSPAARKVRAKCIILVASLPPTARLARHRPASSASSRSASIASALSRVAAQAMLATFTLRRIVGASLPCRLRDVVLVFEQHAQRVVDRLAASAPARRAAISAVAQSIVSATPGSLNRSILRSFCTKPTTWRDRCSLRARRLAARISSSRSAVGIIDPVIEAAPLQRVVDLARAVGGDDDDRRLLRLDRADLRDRDLEIGQHFEQIGLERLVGAVELVDQQHRRAADVAAPAPGAAAA